MEKETQTFAEWFNTLSMAGFVNVMLLVITTLIITILVLRTFRGKADV